MFLYINLWWTINGRLGNIQVSNLTKEYYWKIIGRWSTNIFLENHLDNKDSYFGYPEKFDVLYFNDFNTINNQFVEINGDKKIILNEMFQNSGNFEIYNVINKYEWVRVSADIICVEKEWNLWNMSQFILKFYDENSNEIKVNSIRIQRHINQGESKTIFLDAKIPVNATKLSIIIWNADSKKSIYIDNMKIIGFNNQ